MDGEFLINTYTADHQQYPAVALDENGNFIVAWQSAGQDGSLNGIYAQRFNGGFNGTGGPQSIDVTVNNVAPTVNAGPDQTVTEGDLVELHGSFTDPGSLDTQTFLWQVSASNGQVIADGTTEDFSFTPSDNGTYTVDFTVTDDDGGSNTDQALITVQNGSPNVTIEGSTTGVRAFEETFTLRTADASSIDQSADFTFVIDWGDNSDPDNDTVVGQTVIGPDGLQVPHTFKASGTYVVSVTAMDKDGAVSTAATHTIEIASAATKTLADTTTTTPPTTSPKTKLLVGTPDSYGTPESSGKTKVSSGSIIVTFLDATGNVLEQFHFVDQIDEIVVQGQESPDEITIDEAVSLPVQVFGGPGDDLIQAGSGPTLISGDEGNDTLIGGTGINKLDGGDGDDTFVDTGGTNTVVGGTGNNTFVPGGGSNDFETDPANTAATVFADAYDVEEGGELLVDVAEGVLANDLDPNSDSSQAFVVTPPSHGTLVLGPRWFFHVQP